MTRLPFFFSCNNGGAGREKPWGTGALLDRGWHTQLSLLMSTVGVGEFRAVNWEGHEQPQVELGITVRGDGVARRGLLALLLGLDVELPL